MNYQSKKLTLSVIWFVILCLMTFAAAFPLFWAVSTSLKLPQHIFTPRFNIIPSPIVSENYRNVLLYSPFFRFLLNTLIVVFGTIGLTIILGSHAGYFIARFRVGGRGLILLVLAIGVMMQSVAILVPLYLLSKKLGLHDTYLILILAYSGLLIPQTVWLAKGFAETIPRDLEDAAMVEGCSRLRAYYLITFPLLRPGLVAAAIAIFVYVWNDFLLVIMLTSSTSMQLIQVGLFHYYSITTGIPWGEAMAFLIFAVLPIFAVFLLSSRRVIKGLAAGGLKG